VEPQTVEAVAAEDVILEVEMIRVPEAPASSLFVTLALRKALAVLLHRLAATPTIRLTRPGHLQHEPLCAN